MRHHKQMNERLPGEKISEAFMNASGMGVCINERIKINLNFNIFSHSAMHEMFRYQTYSMPNY